MKLYVKIILSVAIFALWVVFGQMSKDKGTADGGCGGGTCSVTQPTDSKK